MQPVTDDVSTSERYHRWADLEARDAFMGALVAQPARDEARLGLAVLRFLAGERPMAMGSRRANEPAGFSALDALLAWEKGHYAQSAQALTRFRRLAPEHPALGDLVRLLATRPERPMPWPGARALAL